MTAHVQPDIAARRAALAVHALGAEDRAWVLAQLPAPQRALIEPLLAELCELGIQSDSPALEEIQAEATSRAPPAIRLDRRAIQDFARMLEQEAPEVVRSLVDSRDPAWRRAMLKALDPGFVLRVNRLPPAPAGGPALRAALAAAAERRLEAPRADAPASRPWWSAWASRRRTA